MSRLVNRFADWRTYNILALIITIASLLIFFGLALEAAILKAPTADEGMHLLRGQALRQTEELALQGQHTPLSHWLIGTFFFTESTLPDVESLPSWPLLEPEPLVQEFLWKSGVDVTRALFLGRLSIIYIGLLMGAILANWAKRRAGALGQIMAVILFAFSPNLLASTALATTDLVATATFITALFLLWLYWRNPSFWRWLLAAIALGLALSAKLTGLLMLPITLLLCFSQGKDQPWWRRGLVWLSMLPIAGLVVWAAYGFEIGRIAGFSIPVPAATFVNNFVEVQEHVERGHYSFLLGERSNAGWWHYFGVAFLVKTPVVTITLLIISLIYLSLHRKWLQTIFFWLPAVFLFAAASYSRLNIGYRHILPLLPLIWLLIAESAPLWRQKKGLTILLSLILLFYIIIGLRQRPHFLSYYNEFAGGSSQGYRYLGDSNIDWGQDLKLLVEYAQGVPSDNFFASYFGPSDPGYYGLDEPALFDDEGAPINFAPANPAPGRYAISVNHLQGTTEVEPDLFDWFRRREPDGNLGYSILLYEVADRLNGKWVGQCLDPVPYLDEMTAEQLVGQDRIRHVYFECRSSWVIPTGGESGWYVLPADIDPQSISDELAKNLQLVFSNWRSPRTQAYNVYYWSGSNDIIDRIVKQTGPLTSIEGLPLDPPLKAKGIVQFLGGLIDETTWGSIWKVEGITEEPLSVLLHLYAGDPSPSVGDGLGYPNIQWQPGDIFIQFRDFESTNGRYLETGLYNYVTGERLPLDSFGEVVRVYPPPE